MAFRLYHLALIITLLMPNWCLCSASNELGIKLCGREFIRTVVMSCGGSRWKRYSPEPGQERVNPYTSRDFIDWLNRDFLDNPESFNSLYNEGHSARNVLSPVRQQQDTTMEQLQGPLYDSLVGQEPRSTSLRMRRSVGPAGSCCQRGCTKTELMKFC
ncbi:relaxin family locus C type II precursor [Xenopus tropicalis]|uniref:Relaxin family locus C type II n=1 Tax=Xenopus tropicalis TaxID=8364 RepID=B1PT69_XENTR|nr:relaxin family locus C type II precursor [Xenopus tropicalis]ACA50451.1 relaxin family locus C type II [Xenopus tropicalis]|eukprot:NP_001120307.1 relaxin family locus C type II precursor [Xenopus tropicalis]